VILVEWFGNNQGSGYRAHYWYDAYNFAGLLGWAIVILAFVITVDRAVLERIIKRATRWRTTGTSFG
jgi:ABC-type nitrate/sulfonate/bicarbonate transport system permease component